MAVVPRLNTITNEIKREICKINNNNFIKNLDFSIPFISIPSIQKKKYGRWTKSIENQAETMENYLQKIFTSGQPIPLCHLVVIKKDEIYAVVKKLKNKSSDYDIVTTKMLKDLLDKDVRYITILISAIYKIRYFSKI